MKNLVLLILFIFAYPPIAISANNYQMYDVLYTKANTNVILVSNSKPNSTLLSSIGNNQCNSRNFCLIWFFNTSSQAKLGISRLQSGNVFDPIPGLIGIYSKNKVVNELICYDLSGKEC